MLYSVSGPSSYFGGIPIHKKISTLRITPSVSLVAIKARAADNTLSRLFSLRLSSRQNPLARMSNSPFHRTDMLEKKFEQIDGRETERSVKRGQCSKISHRCSSLGADLGRLKPSSARGVCSSTLKVFLDALTIDINPS